MIDIALLRVIRRWHFRGKLSIREISRDTGLSRNTVRKSLHSDAVEPAFKVTERPGKLDAFAGKLSVWLCAEAAKKSETRASALKKAPQTNGICERVHKAVLQAFYQVAGR